ncbi:MAG: type IV pili methyl-accepting chemotaxis transducer N-terminal domain-containing protein [Sulfurovum sp.]|nr:type IV pili methyl-accepting chemotaxis transducer N-terminal domain-containing protein [Sulfurovum sp.]
MKNHFKQIFVIGILTLAIADSALAQDPSSNPEVIADTVKLINITGKQRMLSQRIAKDYLYAGKKVATSKATQQLKKSMQELSKVQEVLMNAINDEEIKNLLAFVEMGTEDFDMTANEAFSIDNAQLIIDLSESMLEGSQYVVDSLKADDCPQRV